MIISANPQPDRNVFDSLLYKTLEELNIRANISSTKIEILLGNKLEPFVKDVMAEKAIGTSFENSIELISGQKFPDIIANKYYGVEVKSTTQNHWKTTGNSVLESTRVDGVERIFMLFGKLGKPIEFRCRPYEECLSEVVVTHSPRYLIDMNLEKGSTIFDKMNTNYNELRSQPNPIKSVVAYYKNKLKPGEEIWWLDQGDHSKANNFIIKIWNNLSILDKQTLKVKAMTFFPEAFGNSNKKYERIAMWLIMQEGVVCPNVRDLFTASGKVDMILNHEKFNNVPKIFKTLVDNLPEILECIHYTSAVELSKHWRIATTERKKIKDWINIVVSEGAKLGNAKHLHLEEMMNAALKNL